MGPRAAVRHYLMCPPTYFAVRYRINPWMRPGRPVDAGRALRQWQRVRDRLRALGHQVSVMPPHPDHPDLVFTANGGIVIGDRALVPRFRHAERAGESAHFAVALGELGVSEIHQAQWTNEGEGDFLLTDGRMLSGVGQRSDSRAVTEVAEFFDVEPVPLTLVDPRFYHLDTALARLAPRLIAYWPGAFDAASMDTLRQLFPDAVLADEQDAAALALNIVSDGKHVIMAPGRERLAAQLADRGLDIFEVATDELGKAGGGAKCCVLEHHRAPER